ncbi:MAG: GNAT family N-acetyltransferase [Chloroflexi bacterium]|nr:GNAT family N-acetyltransferase [Chloroflexota bacterium]
MSKIEIRAAESSDTEAIHDIMNCPGVIHNTMQLPWRSLDQRRDWVAQRKSDDHFLVAVVDGHVVGNLGLGREGPARRNHVASMGMSVHDDFQNRGVGTALMAAMVDLADNWLGIRRIELTVWTDNLRAIHLYEKYGFVIEGTGRQFGRRAGAYVHAHYMARLRSEFVS